MLTLKNIIDLQENTPSDMKIDGSQRNTKIMFHKIDPKRTNINPKYNLAGFEEYQKEHWNRFFSSTAYVFSFWYEGKTARFIGCYKMNDPIYDTVTDKDGKTHERIRFPSMERTDFLSEYCDRLYIEWTNPSANYGRFIDDERYYIHRIDSSKDNSIGSFPNEYYEIRLSFDELKKIYDYPIDNSEWANYLSSHSGVYVIYDKSTDEQYIGSAYGEYGFWGRWGAYSTRSDGNTGFKNKDYGNFIFSILWETQLYIDKDKIINTESEFKKSLGTRIKGLNNN